jgi:hypothetical protein
MRKIYFLLAFIIIAAANSCQEEASLNSTTEQDSKFPEFKDWNEFYSTAQSLAGKDLSYLKDWESKKGFVSLKSVFETAVLEEEKFGETLIAKYGENSTLTRKDFGYSESTTKYITSGAFNIGEFEELIMNVTVPHYATVVNADGIVKIGQSIVQFKHDFIKTIKNGDVNQIKLLNTAQGSNNISVEPVQRTSTKVSDVGRTKELSACNNTVGSYRLIAYEELVWGQGATCGILVNYYIRMRSLKKILGTWQNHNTGSLQVVSNHVKISSYQASSIYGDHSLQLVRVIVDETDVVHDLAFGNDENHDYLRDFDWRCETRTGYNDCIAIIHDNSDITCNGKNGTTCNVGHVDSADHGISHCGMPLNN